MELSFLAREQQQQQQPWLLFRATATEDKRHKGSVGKRSRQQERLKFPKLKYDHSDTKTKDNRSNYITFVMVSTLFLGV